MFKMGQILHFFPRQYIETIQSRQYIETIQSRQYIETVQSRQYIETVQSRQCIETIQSRQYIETIQYRQYIETIQSPVTLPFSLPKAMPCPILTLPEGRAGITFQSSGQQILFPRVIRAVSHSVYFLFASLFTGFDL